MGITMTDNLENPIVHSDLPPVVGEECEMAPKYDRGRGGWNQWWYTGLIQYVKNGPVLAVGVSRGVAVEGAKK